MAEQRLVDNAAKNAKLHVHGNRIDLEAFGRDNAALFAQWLTATGTAAGRGSRNWTDRPPGPRRASRRTARRAPSRRQPWCGFRR